MSVYGGWSEISFAGAKHTTVDADDTVATGLSEVYGCVASLSEAPVAGATIVVALKGDQAGAPAAGSIQIKTYKPTAAGDTAPVAATTFSIDVDWFAWGKL